jgi:DNA-binding transcriptional LysR family regulator
MNLVLLNAFVTVADTGSIGAAAQLLGCSQPGLSQRVQALEHRLNCQLLHREPTGTRPTTAGTTILPLARDLLDLAHRIRNEAQQHPRTEK